jgi:hypothetical protein
MCQERKHFCIELLLVRTKQHDFYRVFRAKNLSFYLGSLLQSLPINLLLPAGWNHARSDPAISHGIQQS